MSVVLLVLLQTLVPVAVQNNPLLYCKELNIIHSKVYNIYADKVIDLLTQQFKDEDIEGKSRLMPNIIQYRMAVLLVVLFYRDFTSKQYSFDELIQCYEIDTLRECFRCLGINLKILFKTVGINICPVVKDCGEGIESDIIEGSFQIEHTLCGAEEVIPPTGLVVNIAELLLENDSCTILIN